MVGKLIVMNVIPVDILKMQGLQVDAALVQVDGKLLWCFVFVFLFFFVTTVVIKAVKVTRLLLFHHELTFCIL
jgi:hypothetical protein